VWVMWWCQSGSMPFMWKWWLWLPRMYSDIGAWLQTTTSCVMQCCSLTYRSSERSMSRTVLVCSMVFDPSCFNCGVWMASQKQ
jgi:hypothetical protein